ncbi:macro domain-containing protein [Deferribacterales bacterium Es71-Z0220]|jgi:O-acetyl-ADP-ribose deacetylase (regulator of RNase III)|uniref:macro domain-containing protein n=1 Tax=Deferrivibrio essentukiensis TaxID=2880922 RepID=UPI001F6135E4|nr:macro domain-containing protein [Deferrivibrio essentukiensis]MCB4204691.1 macro domain-containing protein [Deferrivibrio essentukiensis]
MEIILIKGDITELDIECIVNPANSKLILGSGVAGAIRQKGGEKIQLECNKIGHCEVGDAVITTGGSLKANYVIHAVGPRYSIDKQPEKKLYNAVYNALKLANRYGISSIAFPAISTGIFGYPIKEAAHIILTSMFDFKKINDNKIKYCYICLFSEEDFNTFQNIYGTISSKFK